MRAALASSWWATALAVAGGLLVIWLALVLTVYLVARRTGEPTTLRAAVRLLPDVLVLVRRLAGDPSLSRGVRWRLVLLLAYLAFPSTSSRTSSPSPGGPTMPCSSLGCCGPSYAWPGRRRSTGTGRARRRGCPSYVAWPGWPDRPSRPTPRSAMEADGAVWTPGVSVGVVVDALVVPVAQGDCLVEVGASAVGPGLAMMELGPCVGTGAAVGGAGVVLESGGDALGLGEQPGLAAEVEGDGGAAEDRGDEPGAAGEAAGFAGGDGVSGVESGGLEGAGKGVVVEGDHDGGRGPVVQVVGGQVLEELGERNAAAVSPVEGAGVRAVRMRRGAVRASRILCRKPAAVVGTVK